MLKIYFIIRWDKMTLNKKNTIDYYFKEIDKHPTISQEEIVKKIDLMNAYWDALKKAIYTNSEAHKFFVNEWKKTIEENKIVCRMNKDLAQAPNNPAASAMINVRMQLVEQLITEPLYDTNEVAQTLEKCNFTNDILSRAYQHMRDTGWSSNYTDDFYNNMLDLRNQIVNSNLKLVVKFAKRYQNLGVPMNDLIQEGNLGLIRCIETFDTKMDLKFATYAVWWIKQGFFKVIRKSSRLIRVPHYVQETLSRINKRRDVYRKENDGEPSLEWLAKSENMTEEELEILYNLSLEPISLEGFIRTGGEGENEKQLKDFLPDPSVDLEEDLDTFKLNETLDEVLSAHLTSVEKTVIINRYGVFNQTALTLEEIANMLGKSRERIRQIEAGALEKLKVFAIDLKEYL